MGTDSETGMDRDAKAVEARGCVSFAFLFLFVPVIKMKWLI